MEIESEKLNNSLSEFSSKPFELSEIDRAVECLNANPRPFSDVVSKNQLELQFERNIISPERDTIIEDLNGNIMVLLE